MIDPSNINQNAHLLSNKVEQQVRSLIGDLQMQLIVLRSMLEVAQGQGQEQQPVPSPTPPGPAPTPPAPTPPAPPANARTNGVRPAHEISQ